MHDLSNFLGGLLLFCVQAHRSMIFKFNSKRANRSSFAQPKSNYVFFKDIAAGPENGAGDASIGES
jgi:hypothetical protein